MHEGCVSFVNALFSHASVFRTGGVVHERRMPTMPTTVESHMPTTPSAPTHHTHMPNVDNIAKLVLDAINSRSFVDGQLC